jgi:hypothetical protein
MTASPHVATSVECMPPPVATEGKNLREYRPFIEKNIREMFRAKCPNRWAKNVAQLVSDMEVLPFEIDKVVLALRHAQCQGRKTVTEKDYEVACLQVAGEMGMSECRWKKRAKRSRHDAGDIASLSSSLPPVEKTNKKPKVRAIKKSPKTKAETTEKPKKKKVEVTKKPRKTTAGAILVNKSV